MSSLFGRAASTPALGRKQQAVLSFPQQVVQMQQGGGLQHDGGTEDACRAHEEDEQAGGDAIRGAQVGPTLAPAIEDQTSTDSATTERKPPGRASRTTVTIK